MKTNSFLSSIYLFTFFILTAIMGCEGCRDSEESSTTMTATSTSGCDRSCEGEKDCEDLYVPDEIHHDGSGEFDNNSGKDETGPSGDWRIYNKHVSRDSVKFSLVVPGDFDMIDPIHVSEHARMIGLKVCNCKASGGITKFLNINLHVTSGSALTFPSRIKINVSDRCGTKYVDEEMIP